VCVCVCVGCVCECVRMCVCVCARVFSYFVDKLVALSAVGSTA